MMDAIAPPDPVTFDFRNLSARDRYKLMIGTVTPRPIALVTTVDSLGRINAAPFSFFNCLSADPPILAIGVENHPDMSFKDTALNIRLTEVFTVNIVSHAIAEAMHICAVPFAAGHDELQAAGLTAGMTVDEAERKLIELTLAHTGDNKTRAAEILGVTVKTLHNKLKRFRREADEKS